MDKRAFDRAREQFKKKTAELSEDEIAASIETVVEDSRAAALPPRRLLGVTFISSSTTQNQPSTVSLTPTR